MSPPCAVGVAFMRGDHRLWGDLFVMNATMGPFVHSEFFIQRGCDIRFYTAANLVHDDSASPMGGFMPSRRLTAGRPPADQWVTVSFPVTQETYLRTYAWVLQILALRLRYNDRDLWQCCIKCLLPFEKDLDSTNLSTWLHSGVFCSQVCLLLIRKMVLSNALVTSQGTRHRVLTTNSRGCSPNALYELLVAK